MDVRHAVRVRRHRGSPGNFCATERLEFWIMLTVNLIDHAVGVFLSFTQTLILTRCSMVRSISTPTRTLNTLALSHDANPPSVWSQLTWASCPSQDPPPPTEHQRPVRKRFKLPSQVQSRYCLYRPCIFQCLGCTVESVSRLQWILSPVKSYGQPCWTSVAGLV